MNNNIIELERSISVEMMLDSMGIQFFQDGENLRFCCPFHDGQNTTSGAFFKNTNGFMCFSSDCTDGSIMALVTFIKQFYKLTFPQAIKWMEKETQISYKRNGTSIQIKEKFVTYPVPKKPEYKEIKKIDTFFLNDADSYVLYMRERKISSKAAKHFEIKYSDTKYYGQRILFPIKDEFGTTVAYSGRHIDDSLVGTTNKDGYLITKYKIIPKGFDKKQHIYNLDTAKRKKYIIIVEGNISVWSLFDFGLYAVSIIGSKMSDEQAYLILKYFRYKDIYLCFERDNAGRKCQIATNSYLRRYARKLYTIRLPYEFDPDDIKSKSRFIKFMEKAKGKQCYRENI